MDEASKALFKKLAKEQWLEEYKSNKPTHLFFFRRGNEYRKVLASLAAILQQGAALPSQDGGRLKNVIAEIESLLAREEKERERLEPSIEDWLWFTSDYEGVDLSLPHKAWHFVVHKYQGQCYPGTDLLYLTHIGDVLLLLSRALETEPLLDAALAQCCAILHGTLEDTDATLEEIARECGGMVAAGIAALTLDKEKGDDALRDSLARIKDEPKEVWLVKMADRIANLGRAHDEWTREKCLACAEESQLILDALGEASPRLAKLLSEHIEAWRGWYGEGSDGRQVFGTGWALLCNFARSIEDRY
jgi:hypothetical protein